MEKFLSVERFLWKLGLVLGFTETTVIRNGFFLSLSLKSVRITYLETFKILAFKQPSCLRNSCSVRFWLHFCAVSPDICENLRCLKLKFKMTGYLHPTEGMIQKVWCYSLAHFNSVSCWEILLFNVFIFFFFLIKTNCFSSKRGKV